MDITELILNDHREQRRMFALLDELGNDPDRLAPVWHRLAVLLEVHADAEEQLFYPRPLQAGGGAGGEDSPAVPPAACRCHSVPGATTGVRSTQTGKVTPRG